MGSRADGRRQDIARRVMAVGGASVEELAALYSVTSSTIRRDLAKLVASGRLARTYGGILSVTAPEEATLAIRSRDEFDVKRSIARAAHRLVPPGRIFLDAGTTVGALAHELRRASGSSIVTNSFLVIQELSESNQSLELLGGQYRTTSGSFVGPAADAAVERTSFDAAFLSADAVDPEFGLCEADGRQSRLKEMVIDRSAHCFVLAHGAKLAQRPFHHWTALPEAWTLVTDASASAPVLERFAAAGAKILVAES